MTAHETGDVDLVSSGPSFEIWAGRKGRFRVDWATGGHIRLTVSGHGYGAFAEPAIRKYEDAIKVTDKFALLVDFWNMFSYDSEFRVDMQDWGVRHRSRISGLYVATRSKVVRMGVSVVSLTMGLPTRALSDIKEFHKYCERYGFSPDPSMHE